MEFAGLLLLILLIMYAQVVLFQKAGMKNLEYTLDFSVKEAFEGDEILLVETVRNRKGLPLPWLKVIIHTSRWLEFANTSSIITQDDRSLTSNFFLPAYKQIKRHWKLKCLKRGVFRIENVTLVWGDLFSQSRMSEAVKINAVLKVYPSVEQIGGLFIPRSLMSGDHIVRRWIVEDPFFAAGVRDYQANDSLNRIHWQATCREGKLMVRKNEYTTRNSLTVILNIQTTEFEQQDVLYKNTAEYLLKIAATVFEQAFESGMPFALLSNAAMPYFNMPVQNLKRIIKTDYLSGLDHYKLLLSILAAIKLESVRDFSLFLEENLEEISDNEVILITSYVCSSMADSLIRLNSRKNNIQVVIIDNEDEKNLIPDYISKMEIKSKQTWQLIS